MWMSCVCVCVLCLGFGTKAHAQVRSKYIDFTRRPHTHISHAAHTEPEHVSCLAFSPESIKP